MSGVSSRAGSSTGWPLEVSTLIATASGKKRALASPAASGGVEFSQAEEFEDASCGDCTRCCSYICVRVMAI